MSAMRRSESPPPRVLDKPPVHPTTGSPVDPPAVQSSPPARRRPTRISSLHVGLVVATIALVLLIIFLIQNAHTVNVSFLGGHLRVSLAVAMLTAAVAGALIAGVAGAARIGQLRRSGRRAARRNDVH